MIATMKGPTLEMLEPDAGVALSVEMFRSFARHRAGRMAPDDPDLAEDLVQEGMIGLWEADPSRLDFTDLRDRRYAYRAILRRMWSLKRREQRATGQLFVAPEPTGTHRWHIPSEAVGLDGVVPRDAGAE